jgi:RNA polymerase sigma factor (sigma-70 family)
LTQPEQAAAQAVRAVAPRQPDPRPLQLAPPEGYETFYHAHYRELVETARAAGATPEEADDATSKTLTEMYWKWPITPSPLRYARKAVINNFVKDRTRGNRRVFLRLIERGHAPSREGLEDERLAEMEDTQWVAEVLKHLPRSQREVWQLLADGLSRQEIALALNKTADTVRQHICAARPRLAALLHPDGEYRTETSREEAK